MDKTRRTVLATGAAAVAAAAAPGAFAQQKQEGRFYEKANVRIRYEETGSGFPLLIIPGGNLNSSISFLSGSSPFNPMEEFKNEYRCITSDLRNASPGQSSGPLEIDRPWDAYTDDQLGLMDHLGVKEFMVLGFCIGGPMAWNLIKRAPKRVVAAVLAQPSGFDPKTPNYYTDGNMKVWAPELLKRRPDITADMIDNFLGKMFRANPDFVFCVTRDFVRGCQTPVPGTARRRAGTPVPRRHGIRDARTEVGSEHVPVERTQGTDSHRRAADTLIPQGASAGVTIAVRPNSSCGGDWPLAA